MSFQIPESVVDALPARLASADAFRGRYSNDPRAALAAFGFAPAADSGPVRRMA